MTDTNTPGERQTPITDKLDNELSVYPSTNSTPYEKMRAEARKLELRVQELERENRELRQIIEDAPHHEDCECHVFDMKAGQAVIRPCDCWKARSALGGELTSDADSIPSQPE
jgi:hypothetical protein